MLFSLRRRISVHFRFHYWIRMSWQSIPVGSSTRSRRSQLRITQTLTKILLTFRLLKWLWTVAVGPILHELGFTAPPDQNEVWPRVWWVRTGLLSVLPIHAAGYHDLGPSNAAIDRVICSYSPTVKDLA